LLCSRVVSIYEWDHKAAAMNGVEVYLCFRSEEWSELRSVHIQWKNCFNVYTSIVLC